MRRRFGLLFALAAFAGAPAAARDTPSYSLIFTSNRDRDYDVYLATDEGRLRQITRNNTRDAHVRLSPTGRWLAVERESYRAVLVSRDGRDRRELARGTPDAYVSFSPAAFAPRGVLWPGARTSRSFERTDASCGR